MPVVSFIVNATLGSARLQTACAAAAERAGWKPDIVVTETGAAGIAAARRAAVNGAELVVAVGGDGTVRGCAQALAVDAGGVGAATDATSAGGAAAQIPLGIVPLGTANLLAREFRIPRNTTAALRVVFTGRNHRIDLAVTDDVIFTAMAGIGLDAAVVAAARFKHRLGWRSYALSGMAHLAAKNVTFTIQVDDREPITREARSVVVANCGLLPGGFTILRDARPDDGLLDVGVLAPHGPFGWVILAGHVLRGDGRLERLPARQVEITADTPLPRQADGELLPADRKLTVEIRPRSLLVRGVLGNRLRHEQSAIPGIEARRTESRWEPSDRSGKSSGKGRKGHRLHTGEWTRRGAASRPWWQRDVRRLGRRTDPQAPASRGRRVHFGPFCPRDPYPLGHPKGGIQSCSPGEFRHRTRHCSSPVLSAARTPRSSASSPATGLSSLR